MSVVSEEHVACPGEGDPPSLRYLPPDVAARKEGRKVRSESDAMKDAVAWSEAQPEGSLLYSRLGRGRGR